MAINCPNCGQVLPKDNAKFCNSCGTPLHPPPQNSQQGIVKGPLRFPTRPGPYEQIAQQPPSRPQGANRSMPTEPPSWMRTLDRGVRTGESPQQDEATQRVPYSSNRELHAKVWENRRPDYLSPGQDVPAFAEEDTISPDESPVFEDAVEDLPTAHMQTTISEQPVQKPIGTQGMKELKDVPQGSTIHQIPMSPAVWDVPSNDVAQLATNRLASQGQVKPEDPLSQQGAIQAPGPQPRQLDGVIFQKPPLTPQLGAINRTPRPPFQTMANQSSMGTIQQPLQRSRQAEFGPQSQARVAKATNPITRQGMSRKRLALVLALLVVLVASGIVAWIIAIKPFAVASITQPWQQFCDSGLGMSGQYPTGWTRQVDSSKGQHFSDGTDQFSIVSVAANGQDAGTYLRKEASQLGITGLKMGTSASFAGTSWQQAQGSLLQSQTGVTYTEALFVATHGNQFFTIMQIAPPGTYNEEDTTIFSEMRSSLRFSNSCP